MIGKFLFLLFVSLGIVLLLTAGFLGNHYFQSYSLSYGDKYLKTYSPPPYDYRVGVVTFCESDEECKLVDVGGCSYEKTAINRKFEDQWRYWQEKQMKGLKCPMGHINIPGETPNPREN